MNWYKQAKQLTLQISSYVPEYEQLKVLLNGVSYTFYGVTPFWQNRIKYMIEKTKMPHSVIYQKYLKQFSNPKEHEELNPLTPRGHTEQDEQEMMNDAFNQINNERQ